MMLVAKYAASQMAGVRGYWYDVIDVTRGRVRASGWAPTLRLAEEDAGDAMSRLHDAERIPA